MARVARLKVKGATAYYLITSHAVWERQKAFSRAEKDFFVKLLRRLSRLYFVKVLAYVMMDNHFHIVVKVESGEEFSDEEIMVRVEKFYGRKRGKPFYWRRRLSDLSEFVKSLKQSYAQWYNSKHKRKGHLWSDRFHSVLLEEGKALLAAMVYVDLNAVRAGITDKAVNYKWSSAWERERQTNWLGEIKESGEMLDWLEYKACLEGEEVRRGYGSEFRNKFLNKIKHMSRGFLLGGRGFVETMLRRFSASLNSSRDLYELSTLGLFSLKLRA